jgi:hypothetical protein
MPFGVAAVLVIVGLAAAFFITPALQPPQAKLNDKIEGQLAKAEAMLAGYDPSDAVFNQMLAEPTTRPIEGASSEFREELKKRSALVKDALETVRAAVNEREGSGEKEASGSSHVAATRLEAILSYVQANLLRQQAAVQRSVAEQNRARFNDWMRRWADYDAQARGLQAQLSQRTAGPIVSEESEAPTAPAPTAAAETAPKLAAPQRAASGGGLFSSMLKKLPKAPTQPVAVAAKPAPKPAASAPAPKLVEAKPATQPAEAALPPLEAACPAWSDSKDLQLRAGQTFAGAIADLKLCREQVEATLGDARQKAAALEPVIKELQTKLAAAEDLAKRSQKRMLELEQAGVDASDPKALPRYTEAYNAASQQLRKASREATVLKYGYAANAQLSDEEKELLTDPPVTIDKAVTLEERGLEAYASDMAGLQGLIATREALLKGMDAQIVRLVEREKQVQAQLARIDAVRAANAKEALAAAQAATAAAIDADRLENEALNLANGPGRAAASRAERAASDWVASGRDLNNQYPEAQNPRFQMMMGDAPLVGHAKSLVADIDYMVARIQAQRARGLEAQSSILQGIERMGLQGQAVLAAGAKAEPSETWAIDAKASVAAAETARAEAIKAAQASIDKYRSADDDVKRIWPLHANIAAVHYLLRNLTTGAEAQKHCTEARREYDMALRDHRDQPLGRQYQRVIDELARNCK